MANLKVIYTIQRADVGKPFGKLSHHLLDWGKVHPTDVGKRIYQEIDGIIVQLESTKQRDQRMSRIPKIKMVTYKPVPENPNFADPLPDSRHYKILLENQKMKFTFTTYFSQGSAHTKGPRLEEVLYCLLADALSVINDQNFEQFCQDLGYDEDSRRAEKLYSTVMKQTDKFEKFLGIQISELFEIENDVEELVKLLI